MRAEVKATAVAEIGVLPDSFDASLERLFEASRTLARELRADGFEPSLGTLAVSEPEIAFFVGANGEPRSLLVSLEGRKTL